jgi:uncharacterized damage-inducible protein DinB
MALSRHRIVALPLLLLVPVAAACGSDASVEAAGSAEAAAQETSMAAADAQAMVDNLLVQASTARSKLEGLAEAMPEESYDWRPGDGVRSVGEVFIHVAADNYLLPAILGVEAPDETGITTEYATVQAYEAQTLTKAEIVANLTASFDHLEAAVAQTRGDLDQTATAFGTDFTAGGLWTMAVTHLHEHLGQSIAYARSNGVVPPWSR